jgi:peptide/nickel transport system ATP-binding protein
MNPLAQDTNAGTAEPSGRGDVVLSVRDLKTYFDTRDGTVRAVDGVSFDLHRGETLAIVGESGCGKSVTSLSIMRLLPSPPTRFAGGEVFFGNRNLLTLPEHEMRRLRGDRISMIFQEPMTSLNPVLTIGQQLAETLERHRGLSRRAALQKAAQMLSTVHIPEPERRLGEYPHQLSGGMRQRVMIAMALSCDPEVLIADEPTTALDVTIQAQILELMREMNQRLSSALILITHDLGVVAEMAERVIVMYAGRKVEEADVIELFERPAHPYTRGLLGSLPRLTDATKPAVKRLVEIPGIVPSMTEAMEGCAFAPRCSAASDLCRSRTPPFEEATPRHWAACWHSDTLPEWTP